MEVVLDKLEVQEEELESVQSDTVDIKKPKKEKPKEMKEEMPKLKKVTNTNVVAGNRKHFRSLNFTSWVSYVMDFFAIFTLQMQTFERVGPPPVKSWAMY